MSWSYRLGSSAIFERPNEDAVKPKRVVFLSVEGTTTEVCYFHFIEMHRAHLQIDSIFHVEVLKKNDTKSDPDSVLELLDEYVQFRQSNCFEKELSTLQLKDYDQEFILAYLKDRYSIPAKQRNKFEAILRQEHISLLYLDFLSKYHGEDDVFGIVIDRDQGSHSSFQMENVIQQCIEKGYSYFITNPCIEFWLLLHVSDVATEYEQHLDAILSNKLDDSGNTFVSNLLYDKTNQRKTIQLKTFQKYYLPNVNLAIERAKGFAPKEELLDSLGSNLGELFDLLRNT